MNARRLQQILGESLDEARRAMQAIRDVTDAPEVVSGGLSPEQFEEVVQNQNSWHAAMDRYLEASKQLSENKISVTAPQ